MDAMVPIQKALADAGLVTNPNRSHTHTHTCNDPKSVQRWPVRNGVVVQAPGQENSATIRRITFPMVKRNEGKIRLFRRAIFMVISINEEEEEGNETIDSNGVRSPARSPYHGHAGVYSPESSSL